jgi:hypothetical protein
MTCARCGKTCDVVSISRWDYKRGRVCPDCDAYLEEMAADGAEKDDTQGDEEDI